jgi:hypothetical protein
VDYDSSDSVEWGLARMAGDLDVAKAVIREALRPSLGFRIALQDVGVSGASLAQVLRHQPSVGIGHFGEAQLNSSGALYAELGYARKVLPEIEEVNAKRRRA